MVAKHVQTFYVKEIWTHYKGTLVIREFIHFSGCIQKPMIGRAKNYFKEGCQLQDLTIVAPITTPRIGGMRSGGTLGDGDRGDAGRRSNAARSAHCSRSGEVGDHHLLQVRQQHTAADPMATA